MTIFPRRPTLLALALPAVAAGLAGCGTFDSMSRGIAGSVTPYRVEVVQGNFVSREQVEALKTGMSRQQTREVLGTPLVTSLFHADRWDYVFTMRRQGVEPQQRKLTVYFNGDAVQKVEGDTMPSEHEFVAAIDRKRPITNRPVLEASEEQLRAASTKTSGAAPPPAMPVADAALPASYPPLEPAAR